MMISCFYYSDIEFGKSYIDREEGSLMPNQARFTVNSDQTKGFLRFSQLRRSSDAEWKQYFVNSGKLSIIASGYIKNFFLEKDNSDVNYTKFSTTNNDYAIVYLRNTTTNNGTLFETHGRNTCRINVKQRSGDIPDYFCTIQFLSSHLLNDSSNITRFDLTLYDKTGRMDLSNIQIE
ncbi:13853_t:CDS:2, partial [Racocetra persica]